VQHVGPFGKGGKP
jgi:hypothetical protein